MFITWINQSKAIQVSVKNGSLERGHFSLWGGRAARGVGKPSVVLGRLTWKWWSKGHLRCLVEAIKRIDQENKQHLKRASHDVQVVFLLVLSCKQWSRKDEASQPQQDSALDHKWFSIHMGEDLIYQLVSMIGLHQAYQLDFTLLLEKWFRIYVTILFSNIAKVSLYCAWSFHPLLVCS